MVIAIPLSQVWKLSSGEGTSPKPSSERHGERGCGACRGHCSGSVVPWTFRKSAPLPGLSCWVEGQGLALGASALRFSAQQLETRGEPSREVPTTTVQIVRDQRGWLCLQTCPVQAMHGLHAPTPAHTSTRGTQILIRLEFGPLRLTHSSTSGVLASWGDSSDEVRGTSENPRQAAGHRACCLGLAWPERPHPSLRVQGCRECGRDSASNSQNGVLGHLACGGSPRSG